MFRVHKCLLLQQKQGSAQHEMLAVHVGQGQPYRENMLHVSLLLDTPMHPTKHLPSGRLANLRCKPWI